MNSVPPRDLFREKLQFAKSQSESRARLLSLAQIASERLGYSETLLVDRALQPLRDNDAGAGLARLRIALLSDCTVEHLLPAIRVSGLGHGLLVEMFGGAYGQYRQEIEAEADDSALALFNPDVVVLALSARSLFTPTVLGDLDAENASLTETLDNLRHLWRKARERLACAVVQQTLLDTFEPILGNHDLLVPGTPARFVSLLNHRIVASACQNHVRILDANRAAATLGLAHWFDHRWWLQARMEVAPVAAGSYGDLLASLLAAERGRTRKCLVLDLDNTLWGGVVGDVGVEGIMLGQGSSRGEAHLALQRYVRNLQQRGVVLAVCSKNELAIAERPFVEHPEMILKRDDFAIFIANWEDKAANLIEIAARLNFGLDSLVFLDDNPAERARVRETLPMVAVPELPDDPAFYVSCLAGHRYFESLGITAEDLARSNQYAQNTARETERQSARSLSEFLEGLDMRVVCGLARHVDLPRVAQLINKTNQFNTTGRRRSEDEVRQFASEPQNLLLQFRLADRFGDNGLVSAILLRPAAQSAPVWEIDTWVMSCRVFGRQLEEEAINFVVELARERGIAQICADYFPNEKNHVIDGLFERLGFLPCLSTGTGSSRSYMLSVADYRVRPTFIRRCSVLP